MAEPTCLTCRRLKSVLDNEVEAHVARIRAYHDLFVAAEAAAEAFGIVISGGGWERHLTESLFRLQAVLGREKRAED